MEHVNQEDLVLLYYGEPGADQARVHVEECAVCRTEYQALQRLLNTMDAGTVPERDADYGRRVWERVSARARARTYTWRAMGAIAAGLLLGIALQFGGGKPATVATIEPVKDDVATRVLEAALESHFESSRLVLMEIVNQQGTSQMWSRETAEDLLADNRLYRQTAESMGQVETERLLEDLEEVLVEVAHAPVGSAASTVDLRRRIESKGVLFAIQVRTSREGIL